jgi:hypothetical protein
MYIHKPTKSVMYRHPETYNPQLIMHKRFNEFSNFFKPATKIITIINMSKTVIDLAVMIINHGKYKDLTFATVKHVK